MDQKFKFLNKNCKYLLEWVKYNFIEDALNFGTAVGVWYLHTMVSDSLKCKIN